MKLAFLFIAAALTMAAPSLQAQTIDDLKPPASISESDQEARMNEVDVMLEQGHALLEQGRDPDVSDRVTDSGKVAQAVQVFEKALNVSETWLGEGPYTAHVLTNLAFGYVVSGETDKAIAAYERAVHIIGILHGDDDAYLMITFASLGFLHTDAGHFEKAETAFLKALRCAENGDEEDRTYIPEIFRGLADLYDKMERPADAEAMRARADAATAG